MSRFLCSVITLIFFNGWESLTPHTPTPYSVDVYNHYCKRKIEQLFNLNFRYGNTLSVLQSSFFLIQNFFLQTVRFKKDVLSALEPVSWTFANHHARLFCGRFKIYKHFKIRKGTNWVCNQFLKSILAEKTYCGLVQSLCYAT